MQVRVIGARSIAFQAMCYSSINSPFWDMKIPGLSNRVIEKNLRINMPYHDCACNAVDTLDAGPSYRRQFYCVSSPVEQN
jgi:hypothetical protein